MQSTLQLLAAVVCGHSKLTVQSAGLKGFVGCCSEREGEIEN